MNGNCLCEAARSPSRRVARRFFEAAGCVMPGVMMALLPKCPACLAAWLALATGVGLSVPAAGILRTLLLVLSLAPLIFLAARARSRARELLRGRLFIQQQPTHLVITILRARFRQTPRNV